MLYYVPSECTSAVGTLERALVTVQYQMLIETG